MTKNYIDEILEEFDEKILFRLRCENCKKLPTKIKVITFSKDLHFSDVIRDFLKQKLQEVAQKKVEEIIPEKGIKWMQEGNRKDRKGFTEGFNFCRDMVIKSLINKE